MVDYIRLDGVSSETIGVYCDTPAVPPMGQQRYTVFQTGAEEDRTTADNTFEDMAITVNLITFKAATFDNSALYAFLFGKTRLEFTRHSGFYYKIRRLEVEQAEAEFDGARIIYKVTFIVAPFRYFVSNPAIPVNSGDIVVNTGTFFSRPEITVAGSGEITISVNGKDFTLFDVAGTVKIDSERHICYSGDNIIYNKDSGSYPLLAVGDNEITWEGTVTSMSIVVNGRCI